MDDEIKWFITENSSRFWSKVNKTTDCWLWVGAKNRDGYGNMRISSITVSAHRLVLLMHGHEIPPGMEVDHLCRVRNCVNPNHLEIVDHGTNIRRGMSGAHMTLRRMQAYQCPNGHEITDDLISVDKNTNGRRCRICSRNASKKAAAKNREKNLARAAEYRCKARDKSAK